MQNPSRSESSGRNSIKYFIRQALLAASVATLGLISLPAQSAFTIPTLHKAYEGNLGERYTRLGNEVYQRGWHQGSYFTQYKTYIPGWVRLFTLQPGDQLLGGIELTENLNPSQRISFISDEEKNRPFFEIAFIIQRDRALYRVIPDQIDSLNPRPAQVVKIDWYSPLGLKVRKEFSSQYPEFSALTPSTFCSKLVAD